MRRAGRPEARPRRPGPSRACGSSARAARPCEPPPGDRSRPHPSRSHLGLPEGDLAGDGGGDDAAPAGRALARRQQNGGAERCRAVRYLVDPVDLHVRKPDRTSRSALDDAAAEVAAQLDRVVDAGAGGDPLRLPAEQTAVEAAGARPVARVELEVHDRIGGYGAHALLSNSLKEPTVLSSVTTGASQRWPISRWKSRNAATPLSGL